MFDATILLVDDEMGFVETMAKRLEKRNIQVFKAYDGDAAMSQLGKHPEIQVVVLDVKMPVKDGQTVLQEIKRDFPLVEVIMLTGHATVENAVEGIHNGAYDYLMKPCKLEELTEKVREAVALKQEHEEKAVEDRMHDLTHRMA